MRKSESVNVSGLDTVKECDYHPIPPQFFSMDENGDKIEN